MRFVFHFGMMLLVGVFLQARTWTFADGSGTLEGELSQFKNGTVIITLASGGKSLNPLEKFSAADQQVILERFPQGNQRELIRTVRTKKETRTRSEAQKTLKELSMRNSWEPLINPPQGQTEATLPELPHFTNLKFGHAPPPITVYPQGSPDGFPLSDLRGKLILVHFWSPSNELSLQALPWVTQLYQKYHSRGLAVVGICLTPQRQLMNQYEERNGVVWPAAQDRAQKIYESWGASYLPAYVLIDQNFQVLKDNIQTTQLEPLVKRALGIK